MADISKIKVNGVEYDIKDSTARASGGLPVVTAADNGKVLKVANGAWAKGNDEQGSGSANAVLYTAQSLTDAQKQQARNNIGAGTNWSTAIIDAFDTLLDHVKFTDATGGQLADAFITLLRGGASGVTVTQSGSTLIFGNVPTVTTITQTGTTLAFA